MVALKEKLFEILDLRKKKLSGQDIKHIVESILLIEEAEEKTKNADASKEMTDTAQKLMKEWMQGGDGK